MPPPLGVSGQVALPDEDVEGFHSRLSLPAAAFLVAGSAVSSTAGLTRCS